MGLKGAIQAGRDQVLKMSRFCLLIYQQVVHETKNNSEGLHAVSTYLDRMYLPAVMLRPVHLTEGPTAYLLHQFVLLFAHHPSDQYRTAKQTSVSFVPDSRGVSTPTQWFSFHKLVAGKQSKKNVRDTPWYQVNTYFEVICGTERSKQWLTARRRMIQVRCELFGFIGIHNKLP